MSARANTPTADDDLLTIAEVASLLGISTKTVYRYRAQGNFPEPVRVGARLTRWLKSSVLSFLATTL